MGISILERPIMMLSWSVRQEILDTRAWLSHSSMAFMNSNEASIHVPLYVRTYATIGTKCFMQERSDIAKSLRVHKSDALNADGRVPIWRIIQMPSLAGFAGKHNFLS